MQPCPNTLKESQPNSHFLGWVGSFFVLFGYYLNANMYPSSWLIWIIGNSLVGVYCLKREAYPTAVMSFVLVIMNLYGYISWI